MENHQSTREAALNREDRDRRAVRRGNYAAAGCFIAAGVFLIAVSMAEGYQIMSKYGPGAGFVPVSLGAAQILLGLLLGWRTARGAYDGDPSKLPGRAGAIRILLLLAFCAAAAAALRYLGMAVTVCLLYLLITRFVCGESWRRSILSALAATAILYLLFAVGFSVRFPAGVLGF